MCFVLQFYSVWKYSNTHFIWDQSERLTQWIGRGLYLLPTDIAAIENTLTKNYIDVKYKTYNRTIKM